MRKVNVVGGPGSGKTSFSKQVANTLGVEFLELDAVNWQKNWKSLEVAKFVERIESFLDDNPSGWVIDGSYKHVIGSVVVDAADTIVFLRIPLIISVPRVARRSFQRIVSKQLLWGTNRESIKGALHLLWWTIKFHRRRIRKMKEIAKELETKDTVYKEFRSNRQARKWLYNDAK